MLSTEDIEYPIAFLAETVATIKSPIVKENGAAVKTLIATVHYLAATIPACVPSHVVV